MSGFAKGGAVPGPKPPLTCPHCGDILNRTHRHCTHAESHTCDWLICQGCGSLVAGRRHTHEKTTIPYCLATNQETR